MRKKVLMLTMVGAMMMTMTGCGEKNRSESSKAAALNWIGIEKDDDVSDRGEFDGDSVFGDEDADDKKNEDGKKNDSKKKEHTEVEVKAWKTGFSEGYAWAAYDGTLALVDEDYEVVFEIEDAYVSLDDVVVVPVKNGKTIVSYLDRMVVMNTKGDVLKEVEANTYRDATYLAEDGSVLYLEYVSGSIDTKDSVAYKILHSDMKNEDTIWEGVDPETVSANTGAMYEIIGINDMKLVIGNVTVGSDVWGNVYLRNPYNGNFYTHSISLVNLDFSTINSVADLTSQIESKGIWDLNMGIYCLDNKGMLAVKPSYEAPAGMALPFSVDYGEDTYINTVWPSENGKYYAISVVGVDGNEYVVTYDETGKELYDPILLTDDINDALTGEVDNSVVLTNDGNLVGFSGRELKCIKNDGTIISSANGDDFSFLNGQTYRFKYHNVSNGYIVDGWKLYSLDGTCVDTIIK